MVRSQRDAVLDEIEKLAPEYLLKASEGDLAAYLIQKYRLDVPVILDDQIHVARQRQVSIEVGDRWGGPAFGDEIVLNVLPLTPATEVTVAVPFEGDAHFFRVRPATFTTTLPEGAVRGQELLLTFTRTDADSAALKEEYERELREVRQYLDWLRPSADEFNKGLEAVVRGRIDARKKRALDAAGMVAALGLPMKPRASMSATYSVPLERKKPRLERPVVPAGAFTPEPALSEGDYEQILNIIRNMVRVMECSPHAFETMGEEDLRTHFLVQLNAQFEGQATAETFNYQGKTDILIRVEGENVFIAECKFWGGQAQYLETIDQILSYLSWRDTKAAILVFNRNVNFTEVLEKIAAITPSHAHYKRSLGRPDETTFRYVFAQPEDPNREVLLTVMAFNVPTSRA